MLTGRRYANLVGWGLEWTWSFPFGPETSTRRVLFWFLDGQVCVLFVNALWMLCECLLDALDAYVFSWKLFMDVFLSPGLASLIKMDTCTLKD